MNRLFQRLPLPTKLMLLGVLPLIFLLVISYQLNESRTEKLSIIDTYRKRVDQSIAVNNLIEQLQVERRYAFGFALEGKWQNEMMEARKLSNQLTQKMVADNAATLPGFASYTFLDQLKSFHTKIDNKQADAMAIMTYYTNAIFRLSTQNQVAAGNVLYLQPVIKDLAGQKILSDIITYKGIVRAQVYFMLHIGQANPQLIASVSQTQDIIGAYTKEFIIKGSPQATKAFEDLNTDADVKAMRGYLEQLRSTGTLDTTMEADRWWDISANAVDRIMEIQQQSAKRLKEGIDAIYTSEQNKQRWSIALLLAMIAIVIGFILYISRSITRTLSAIRESAQIIAKGKTGTIIKPESGDVIASLTHSIIQIDSTNKQLAQAAEAIGKGNFSVPVQPRSDEDILGNAIVQMKDNLENLSRTNEEKIWTQTGIGIVNDAIRGDKDLATLGNDALTALIRYLGCESGLLYTNDEEELYYTAGYAISGIDLVPQKIHFGETLIGQAALQKELLLLENVPDDFLKIRSGAGMATPRQVLILPLINDHETRGVIELSSLTTLPPYKIDFVKEVASDIAIAVQVTKSKMRLQELVEETQTQSEELQTQHRELETLNAELEMNTQRLQASEEELKVQQEELMQANQELEERSKLLEERNQTIQQRNIEIQRKAEELEVSTKYKSEFLANMSHELRTPLKWDPLESTCRHASLSIL